jgi:hypothetical protein
MRRPPSLHHWLGMFLAGTLITATGNFVAWARDAHVPHEFQRTHPCPSTGKTTGAYPGYVRDHVVPLGRSRQPEQQAMADQGYRQGKG